MLSFGLIDDIVREPLGGSHNGPEQMAETLKNHIKAELALIMPQDPEERITARINKYSKMGHYKRLPATPAK
jgi:acetyl-CoA carboxylase carboxyl transferase subunit alpha